MLGETLLIYSLVSLAVISLEVNIHIMHKYVWLIFVLDNIGRSPSRCDKYVKIHYTVYRQHLFISCHKSICQILNNEDLAYTYWPILWTSEDYIGIACYKKTLAVLPQMNFPDICHTKEKAK